MTVKSNESNERLKEAREWLEKNREAHSLPARSPAVASNEQVCKRCGQTKDECPFNTPWHEFEPAEPSTPAAESPREPGQYIVDLSSAISSLIGLLESKNIEGWQIDHARVVVMSAEREYFGYPERGNQPQERVMTTDTHNGVPMPTVQSPSVPATPPTGVEANASVGEASELERDIESALDTLETVDGVTRLHEQLREANSKIANLRRQLAQERQLNIANVEAVREFTRKAARAVLALLKGEKG